MQLREAVDGEIRHGTKEWCRPELNERWDKVIASIEKLCLKTPKSRKK